ncbi:MAG: hypothetical protein CMP67_00965 [Flavobacteriales bacterium]|nr:hypothetical protein [Flavobacteriales bacterium]|tara:strand:- start:883 stop:2010 length:1128 start_codon:yes stop_codon:yes gene_type:complete
MKTLFQIILLFPLFSISQTLTSTTNIDITKYWYQEPSGYKYPIKILIPNGDVPEEGFPVCILLHGNGGNGSGMINQFKNVLECHALVAPSGYLNSWNICGESSDAPDLEMVNELINHLQTYSNVNPNKIRILGSSNGSALANNVFITNKNPGIDIVCAIVSHLNEPQFHLGNFYATSSSTEPSNSYCGYDSLVDSLNNRKYLSISNENDPIIPYYGGTSVVGVDFLDAETAVHKIAMSQGFTGDKITNGTTISSPEITEYSYLSGNVVHIKGDAEHGTNSSQKDYINAFFTDCDAGLSYNDVVEEILSVFPNPTKDKLTINTTQKPKEIRVFSTSGVLLLKSHSKILNISGLTNGFYILEFEFENKIIQKQIIKQ